MKRKIGLAVLLLLLLTCNMLFSQTESKHLNAVRKNYEKGDYSGMLHQLAKFSSEEKTQASYHYYSGIAYDSTGEVNLAIAAYSAYLTIKATDTVVQHRVEVLNEIVKVRRACSMCKGAGFYTVEEKCSACNGTGEMKEPCHACQGTKKIECSNCSGSGHVGSAGSGVTTCNTCGGTGKLNCQRCHQTGVTEDRCRYCNGGMVRKKVKCTLHP